MTAAAVEHAACASQLRDAYSNLGFDVTVSTARPLVRNMFTRPPFICPHNVPFWVEPTGEQLAAWVAQR